MATLPPPPPPHAGFPPMSRANLPTAVLLTKLPTSLMTVTTTTSDGDNNNKDDEKRQISQQQKLQTAVRQWVTGGLGMPPRSVQCITLQQQEEEEDKGDDKETIKMETDESTSTNLTTTTCLIGLANPEAAAQLAAALKQQQQDGDNNDNNNNNNHHVHLVPVNPDMPLPPPMVDPEICQKVVQGLAAVQQDLDTHGVRMAEPTTMEAPSSTTTINIPSSNNDEEEDPLTTPAVLAAVKHFRESLEAQQGTKATRRKELVQVQLNQAMERLRASGGSASGLLNISHNNNNMAPPPRPPAATGMPPPPPPGGPPLPPPLPAVAAAAAATDAAAAPRGVSNLPAWMTAQQQQSNAAAAPPLAETTAEFAPAAKRQKVEMDWSTTTFSSLDASAHDGLRAHCSALIAQALDGEADETLINFCVDSVINNNNNNKGNAVTLQTLQSELSDVLDPAQATSVVESIYQHVENAAAK